MSILLLVARLLLAVVFIVAGLSKFGDLKGSQKTMREFGVPPFLAAPSGILLPIAELAVAIALLVTPIAFFGAIGALVLLVLFIIGISANLSLGRTPDCNCFGQLHSEPIGASTLIRNIILGVIASLVIWQGAAYSNVGYDLVGWISKLTAFEDVTLAIAIVLLALVGLESWLLVQTMTQQGRLLVRLEAIEENGGGLGNKPVLGLPEGEDAPDFALPDAFTGATVTLKDLLPKEEEMKTHTDRKPVVLVFSSPECGPCNAMIPDYIQWMEQYSHRVIFAMVSTLSAEANRAKFAEYNIEPVLLLQEEREVAEAYKVRGTPSAVAIRFDGSIHGELAEGEDSIRDMLKELTTDFEAPKTNPLLEVNKPDDGLAFPVAPKVGELAHDLTMLDYNEQFHKLSELRGEPTLLLFWNPGCSFCDSIKRDMLVWERKPPKCAPKLVIISTGGSKKDYDGVFKSLVIKDDTPSAYSIARWFKLMVTPAAALLDENGIVLARGEGVDEVMQLTKSVKRKGKLATV